MPSRILVLGFDVSVTIVLPGVVPLKSLGVPGKERSKVFNLVSLGCPDDCLLARRYCYCTL